MSYLSVTLVVLRESFEAFLIVGILLGIVRKLGAPNLRTRIIAGTVAGFVASVVIGLLLLQLAGDLRAHSKTAVEFGAAYLAVAVLTYMVVWMYKHTQDLLGGMHSRVKEAITTGALGALFFTPFIAVVREGFETVLFLAADPDAPTGLALVGCVVIGLSGSVLLGALLFSGIVRLSVETFFAVTGALLVLFGAWILRYGTHEGGELLEKVGSLHEVGEFFAHAGSYVVGGLYLVIMMVWFLRPILRRRKSAPTA